jgi:hypothetical protein
MARRKVITGDEKNPNWAVPGFEAKLSSDADKLPNSMKAAEYKHVVLGFIFLKYICNVLRYSSDSSESARYSRSARSSAWRFFTATTAIPISSPTSSSPRAQHLQRSDMGFRLMHRAPKADPWP